MSTTDEMSGDVLYDVRDGAAWITINRPHASNAVTLGAGAEIRAALDRADVDPDVRAIILTGAGDKVFSAGADLKELPPTRHDPAEAEAYDRAFDQTMLAMERCSKPTIARLNGHVVGGSLALAMGCDIRIAAERVLFRIPVARLGFMYTPDQTTRIVRAIGPSRAKWMIFSGNAVTAAQALQWGLIDQLAADDQFSDACHALIADICAGAPLTHQAMKDSIDRIARDDPRDADHISATYRRIYGSDDLKEGMAAVAEKRTPDFKGE